MNKDDLYVGQTDKEIRVIIKETEKDITGSDPLKADREHQKLLKTLKTLRDIAITEVTAKIKNASASQAASIMGILIDKLQILEGKPTMTTEADTPVIDGKKYSREDVREAILTKKPLKEILKRNSINARKHNTKT